MTHTPRPPKLHLRLLWIFARWLRRARRADTTAGVGRVGAVWTAQRIAALGPVTDLSTAAAILRLPLSTAYLLARTGRFPVPLIRVGTRYRVAVAALLEVLRLHRGTDAA